MAKDINRIKVVLVEQKRTGKWLAELCSLATIGTQELPSDYPQEQSEVQPHEPKVDGRRESQVPVQVREW